MNPECWGPKYWNVLFDCAYWYDRQRNADATSLIKNLFGTVLADALPCSICRDNYTRILKSETAASSLDTAVRKFSVFLWLYRVKTRTLARDDDDGGGGRIESPSLAVIKSRHDTVQSGLSSVDDLIFIVYASVLEQFTRPDGADNDNDDNDNDNDAISKVRTFLATLLACCALVPALSSFVRSAGPSIVAGSVGTNGEGSGIDGPKMKQWFHSLVNLFERTSGRDVDDIVYAFFALCSVSMRRRALRAFGASA